MTSIQEALHGHLDELPVPPGDLDRVRRTGRARRRRRTAAVVTAVAAVAAVAAVGAGVVRTASDDPTIGREYAAVGALDVDEGLRAYADPGRTVSLGGRTFPEGRMRHLDTDAAATPWGMVFFAQGRPYLMGADGETAPLVDEDVDAVDGFHPTAKVDVGEPLLAWATLRDGTATITVRDMTGAADDATTEVDCGRCGDLVLDGIDGGVVFVRDAEGTRTWDTATGEWVDFAGKDTRVADVRNGVVLYSGPRPTGTGWALVEGAVDSQLTHDGGHVLAWSSTLQPTARGAEPVRLEVAQARRPDEYVDAFWTVDTDGSVLVAADAGRAPGYVVHDCEVPSGRCTAIGELRALHGDPMFIGNDM